MTADDYRNILRDEFASGHIATDEATLELARRQMDVAPYSSSPNMTAFLATVLLLFGDPNRLTQLFRTIVDHPEVLREKLYSAFQGAAAAVVPDLPGHSASAALRLQWCQENLERLRWDPVAGIYRIKTAD